MQLDFNGESTDKENITLNQFRVEFSQVSRNKNLIYSDQFSTELGSMYICATKKGICLLEFTGRKKLENQFKTLCQKLDGELVSETNNHIRLAKKEIKKYLSGNLKEFTVELDLVGTDFQKSVWQVLRKIPYGKTWSYLHQAKELKNPKAVRAVANANGANKISLIIPCHRVVGSNGSLTGYAAGLSRKKWLLELEKRIKN